MNALYWVTWLFMNSKAGSQFLGVHILWTAQGHPGSKLRGDRSSAGFVFCSDGAAAKLGKVNMEMLQRKVGTLEEENLNLRLEVPAHLTVAMLLHGATS